MKVNEMNELIQFLPESLSVEGMERQMIQRGCLDFQKTDEYKKSKELDLKMYKLKKELQNVQKEQEICYIEEDIRLHREEIVWAIAING